MSPMNKFLLSLAVTSLFLTACGSSSEEAIQKHIEDANYCDLQEDCILVGSKCPFGCYIYANAKEAPQIQTLVEGYDSQCMYKCTANFGVDCIAHKCEPILQPVAEDTDGNVGATCSNNSDCVTPMSYLTRSSCPFTSQCIQGTCSVTCPMMEHDANPNVSASHPVACTQDSECTCDSFTVSDTALCSCIEGACVAIVER